MTPDINFVIFRCLLPTIFAALGGYLLTRSFKRATLVTTPLSNPASPAVMSPTERIEGTYDLWRVLGGAFLCGLGVIVSEYWSRGILLAPNQWLDWNARYQWNWIVWALPVTFLLMGFARWTWQTRTAFASVMWPAVFLFSIAVLTGSLVELEVWGEHLQMILYMIVVGLIAVVLNVASISDMATTRANRWAGLVLAGQFGCVAAVALQTYASLGETALLGASICFGLTVATLTYKVRPVAFGEWSVSFILYPLASVAVSLLLLSVLFQSKPLLPWWLFSLVLMLPTVVWFFDIVYGRYGRVWWRVVLAASVCLITKGLILALTNPFQSEW